MRNINLSDSPIRRGSIVSTTQSMSPSPGVKRPAFLKWRVVLFALVLLPAFFNGVRQIQDAPIEDIRIELNADIQLRRKVPPRPSL